MKKLFFPLLLCMILLSTACWDVRDVTNRAFVTAIGIDTGQSANNYRITFEIIDPAAIKFRLHRPATIIETIEEESLGTALEKLQSGFSRTITLDHFRVLLIGEEMAKKDFRSILEYFEKNPQVALRLRLGFVQFESAEQIMKTKPRFDNSMSGEFIAMTQLNKDFSLVRDVSFYQFVLDLRSSNGSGFISRVTSKQEGKIMMRHGGGIVKNWKLIGWLSAQETQAANWILGEGSATVVYKSGDGSYTYQAKEKKVRIIPKLEKEKVSFVVKIKTNGDLIEEKGENLELNNPQIIKKIESAFSKVIKQQVDEAVNQSQNQFGVDYLGMGKELKQHYPKVFKKLNWSEVYPQIPVTVQIDANIETFGLSN